VFANAHGKLMRIAADLRYANAVKTAADLDTLIRFHDHRRLFPRDALISDYRRLVAAGIDVPDELTLDQAKKLEAKVKKARGLSIGIRTDRHYEQAIKPHLRASERQTWRWLSADERRAVISLSRLTDLKLRAGWPVDTPICSVELREGFAPIGPFPRTCFI
jgi:hypothetical protein